MEGAFDAIRRLVDRRFGTRVYIVSKCGERTERRTRAWMDHWGFYDETGVLSEHVYFCRERHQKAPIAERLRLTHFVDDKLEVLAHMRDIVGERIAFNPRAHDISETMKNFGPMADEIFVCDWWEVLQHLNV